ncbi:MAG: Ohr family peroxiredoxin [Gemmatimonadetes bacterium]|jgi:osmotically inducible protein OsmC|nr:Ohr family peroxiredoxin [Gemmatimonadota bacterium]
MAGKVIYTAEAHVDGGRLGGHGRTSDGVLEVDIALPGADEPGTNPEQLFAVGYAACFGGALSAIARREKVDLGEVGINSEVDLKAADDRSFDLGVRLNISLPGITDPEQAKQIATAAHKVCPYSRATRGNIEVEMKANGEAI